MDALLVEGLRGDYKQSAYGKVMLPFTVLRRLDCVVEPTKVAVLQQLVVREKAGRRTEGASREGRRHGLSVTAAWRIPPEPA